MPNLIIQSQRGGHAIGASVTTEDKTTPWWTDFSAVVEYHQANGRWPTATHPILGSWTNKTCNALKRISKASEAMESKPNSLTHEKLATLRRAGYPMDGIVAGVGNAARSEGPQARILKAVQNNEAPFRADVIAVRERASHKTILRLEKLGVDFNI